ncbi:SatD family protein [Micrococcoides hystricis]|uniref:SatD family protein n=1 Tax=Micrococcoides hystricis TaxID=1572761 RepID=A0ABV6PCA3_9MICC
MDQPTPVIADIVQSRKLPDRAATQQAIQEAINAVEKPFAVPAGMKPTVGDEFQAVYASLAQARRILVQLKLSLPEEVELRFGIGVGEISQVSGTALQDGPGWYAARAAIEEAESRAKSAQSWVRSWVGDAADNSRVADLNSSLLLEDFLLSKMKPRERRLTLMALQGQTQIEMARVEKISQSAVSQSLQRSGGAALIAAIQLGEGEQ